VVRFLWVEDEYRLAVRRARGLRGEGFAVDTAATTSLAHERVVETDCDLVLLDLKLPRLRRELGATPHRRVIHTIARVGCVLRGGGEIP